MSAIKKPEILAPVGGPEQLIAAVRSGADAVYLGTKGFNARQSAKNFGYEDLKQAVSYCHGRGVRVHVTVNTLIQNSELDALIKEIEGVAASGADAVIIQDLGVMRLFMECCPGIEKHASTQMAIHNADGAKIAKDLGFNRVVLARELSLNEIEKIANSVEIELETFIHGAHCMSLSGACYMSSVIGERSGNRGRCAQPCRTDFKCRGRDYALSLKDMSYIPHVNSLWDAGVSSFKIEGRMKRPEYVAAAVTACRKALAGEPYDMAQLEAVFSRSGFTDGYLTGQRNISMFGRRTEADEARTKEVLGSIAELYRGEFQSVGVDASVSVKEGEPLSLLVSDGANNITVHSSYVPEAAINKPANLEYISRQLSKTGGTPFTVREVTGEIDNGLAVPASVLNSLRREALEQLLDKRSEVKPHEFKNVSLENVKAEHAPAANSMYVRFGSLEQIPKNMEFAARIVLPVDLIDDSVIERFGNKLIAELPSALFQDYEPRLKQKLEELADAGLGTVYCDNIYGINLAREYGLELVGGPCLNIMNSVSLAEHRKLGTAKTVLSFELSMKKAKELAEEGNCGIFAYGKLPLMTVRACPAKGKKGCGSCEGTAELIDRKNVVFPMLCKGREYGVIYNSVPLYIADKDLSGFDFKLLYFTDESAQRCADIMRDYINGSPAPGGNFTRGLYYRNIK